MLNYIKMLEDIRPIVENDFVAEMELKTVPPKSFITQEDAQKMSEMLSSVYSIVHCTHCKSCATKYEIKD